MLSRRCSTALLATKRSYAKRAEAGLWLSSRARRADGGRDAVGRQADSCHENPRRREWQALLADKRQDSTACQAAAVPSLVSGSSDEGKRRSQQLLDRRLGNEQACGRRWTFRVPERELRRRCEKPSTDTRAAFAVRVRAIADGWCCAAT